MIEKVKRDAEKCIEFQTVKSSNIYAVGIHGRDLIVWFKGGKAYIYPDSSQQYHALIAADSVGKYFHKHVRNILNHGRVCDIGGCLKRTCANSNTCIDHSFPSSD